MSPRDFTDRGTRIGLRKHSIATILLAGLVLILSSHPTASNAGESWQQLWADNFDHSINDGWILRADGHGDRVEVVSEGFRYPDRVGRCEANNVLYGKSTSPDPGHGFSASTPALEDLGIRAEIDTYSMSFRYMVVGSEFCWTVPLASPDATLVVSECTAAGTRAVFGVVDHEMKNFRALTEIAVDEWHNITVVVKPLRTPGEREVSVYLEDVLLDRHVRTVRSAHRAMTFLDLPAFPVDVDADDPAVHLSPACFGEGYWDDVNLSVLRNDGTGRNKRQVTIDPNPFNPSTSVCMELEASCWLEITIFDARGRRVRGVHAGVHPAGPVRLGWDGRDDQGRMVGSGVFYVRTTIPGNTHVTRAVLVR